MQDGEEQDAPAALQRTESAALVAQAHSLIDRSTDQIVDLVLAEDERQRALPVPPAPPQAVSRAAAHRSFTKRGFVVSDHPDPAYCGLYKRCSTWNGRPAFKNRHERFFYRSRGEKVWRMGQGASREFAKTTLPTSTADLRGDDPFQYRYQSDAQ